MSQRLKVENFQLPSLNDFRRAAFQRARIPLGVHINKMRVFILVNYYHPEKFNLQVSLSKLSLSIWELRMYCQHCMDSIWNYPQICESPSLTYSGAEYNTRLVHYVLFHIKLYQNKHMFWIKQLGEKVPHEHVCYIWHQRVLSHPLQK